MMINHWRKPKRPKAKRTSKALPKVAVHPVSASGSVNHAGVRICTCGALETSRVHAMPELSDESKELSARIIGEAVGGD